MAFLHCNGGFFRKRGLIDKPKGSCNGGCAARRAIRHDRNPAIAGALRSVAGPHAAPPPCCGQQRPAVANPSYVAYTWSPVGVDVLALERLPFEIGAHFMKISRFALTLLALTFLAPWQSAKAADVICYNCPPEWADWASMLKAIKTDLNYDIPHDNKNSGQALAQILAEKSNPVGDIGYFGVTFGMKAKAQDALEPYKPVNWDQVPAGLKDPDGYWTTIHSGTLGLFVNKDALGGKPVPACWKDLLKPDYKGMVGYLDPSSAAVGYVGAVAINLALGGSASNFDPAISFFKDLRKNDPIVPKQTSYARVVSGEMPILLDYDFNAYRAKYQEKGNFEFVIPCEGSVVFPYVVGLVKNAPDKDKARKVIDYLLSDKGQAIWTNAYLRPARPIELPEAVKAKFLPDSDYARAKAVDWGQMESVQKGFVDRYLAEVR
jgi:putative spermidine/putrescine transport system substrate-binding protein